MLTLPIKKRWFYMIITGGKQEEYREIKPYYQRRFQHLGLLDAKGEPTQAVQTVRLRNGYGATSPTMTVNVTLRIGKGRSEWGAEQNKTYFVLKIVSVEKER